MTKEGAPLIRHQARNRGRRFLDQAEVTKGNVLSERRREAPGSARNDFSARYKVYYRAAASIICASARPTHL